jgi:hypothetical protein
MTQQKAIATKLSEQSIDIERTLKVQKSDFLKKTEILEEVKLTLKSEFFGLDEVIDQIVDYASSWYTLHQIQEKPAIINLWGLTGVGKTSLIKRFVELINFKNKFYRFDIGEKSGFNSFNRLIRDICENDDDSPLILLFDEFQHAKSLSQGKEIEEEKSRTIWEIIDSGRVNYFDFSKGSWYIKEDVKKLIGLIRRGVKIENGLIVEGKELYLNAFKIETAEKFLHNKFLENLFEIASDILNFDILMDLEDFCAKLNTKETLDFIIKTIDKLDAPKEKNFTKSLIFIVGNLDEAYPMTGDHNVDISADEFNKMTQQINIMDVKQALKIRFREEQIARLGNTHVIYPALTNKSYEKIIQSELDKVSLRINESTNIKVIFDLSINELVYKEGVFPTQGARPLFTTIHTIIKSNLSAIFSFVYSFDNKAKSVKVYFENGFLKYQIFDANLNLLGENNLKLRLSLDKLRENRKDEMQAITAVHESGHAILMYLLEGKVPDAIYSVSSDTGSSGFVFINDKPKFHSRKSLLARTAMHLGGLVAEQIIFGEENITMGSSSDLKKLTGNLMMAFKRSGLGESTIYCGLSSDQEDFVYHEINSVEEEVLNFIKQAKKLAKETLEKEKVLLIAMAEYLSVNTNMSKQQVIKMFEEYCMSKPNIINPNFYRNKLNNAKLANSDVKNIAKSPIILNKGVE